MGHGWEPPTVGTAPARKTRKGAAVIARTGAPVVLLVGGGYVGLYAALALERLLEPGEADVVLVNPESFMVYQPLLPEVASGTVEARHAIVPLRRALRRTRILTGRVVGVDHGRRAATVRPGRGPEYEIRYDHAVFGVGSVTRVLPIPGVADRAVGFTSVAEALHLHNHVLAQLETAEAAIDEDSRRCALTFTFVGGGYTGVEALAELEDMARSACAQLPTVTPDELRWVLVEASQRILPTVAQPLADQALQTLRARDIEVRLATTMETCEDGRVRLSDGEEFRSDTIVWVTGMQPHELVTELDLPTSDDGALRVDRTLRVEGTEGAWAAGDNAAVPDGHGGVFPATAQHAQRQGTHLGRNLTAVLRGQPPQPFAYESLGEMITLGHGKGVASLRGHHLAGWLPWLLRRLYYAGQIPTWNRKLRVLADWLASIPFRREVASLGTVEHPGGPFSEATRQSDVA